MNEDNILERVPGQYIAGALQTLLKAETAADGAILEAFVDAPGIGGVCITASRRKSKKGRVSHYLWAAEKAVLA